jgi:hypothetical protein
MGGSVKASIVSCDAARQSKNINLIQLSSPVLEDLVSGNLGGEHCGRKTSGADVFRSILAGPDWSNTWGRRVTIEKAWGASISIQGFRNLRRRRSPPGYLK